jgi:putative NADPH-quinone reductase
MRILLVYCHPVPESFCASIRDTAVRALEQNGHEVDLLDLYAEGFDPVMPADERRHYNEMKLADHPFPAHAKRLQAAEGLLFVYPTWWYGLPAMLKGWLDRVWTPESDVSHPRWSRPDRTADDAYQSARRDHHLRCAALVVLCRGPSRQAHHPARHARALRKELPPAFHGTLPDGQINARKPRQISCQRGKAPCQDLNQVLKLF